MFNIAQLLDLNTTWLVSVQFTTEQHTFMVLEYNKYVKHFDVIQESALDVTQGLSRATFNRITKLDLKWHPYTMNIRHKLFPQDPAQHFAHSWWKEMRTSGLILSLEMKLHFK